MKQKRRGEQRMGENKENQIGERLIRPSINIRPRVKLLREGRKHGLEKEKRF